MDTLKSIHFNFKVLIFMDIEISPPQNNFSNLQISDIELEDFNNFEEITMSNIEGFSIPELSLDISIDSSFLSNLDINIQGIDLNQDLSFGNIDLGNLDLGSLELNFDNDTIKNPEGTWETLGNSWKKGWAAEGDTSYEAVFSNIQNALSLTSDSINFAVSTNFGLNSLVKDAWKDSKAREKMKEWGQLKLPDIADPKNSMIYLENGKSGADMYAELFASQMKNCLSKLGEKAIDGLINDGLGALATSTKMMIEGFLGKGIISNIQNLVGMGKSIFDAGKAFGEAFKSIQDGWFLVPEAGIWSGFIGGDPKNNADAKAGLKAAENALNNIESTLDSAISLLGGDGLLETKLKDSQLAGKDTKTASEDSTLITDMTLEKLSVGDYSPITTTRDFQKSLKVSSLKENLYESSVSSLKGIDKIITTILQSKDVMSNMYDVVFTFGEADTTKADFKLPNIDPFLLSARITGISIPGEEQVSFPTKFCGSNIDRVDNQVNYSHQSSFDILADEALYYIQYFNKLAQVDSSLSTSWGKTTLEAMKKALKGKEANISLAELPAVLSKGKIDLYVRRGFPDSYRFWKFENIRILGPGAGIGFKREGASTLSLSYEFIFENCYEIDTPNSIF